MLELQRFILNHSNWYELLTAPPYSLKIEEKGDYVLFKYKQIDSDFSEPIVNEARGIILKKPTFEVVRMAFTKFYNLGEVYAAAIDWDNAWATEKLDGSLISLWWDDGSWHVSTNGCIDARDAKLEGPYKNFYNLFMAALMKTSNLHLEPRYIYSFELVSPFNTIVINYLDIKLYHILTRSKETLEEVDISCGVAKPTRYYFSSQKDCQSIVDSFDESHEGVVVQDINGKRVKLKTPKYFELHRLINNNVITAETALYLIKIKEDAEFLLYFPRYIPWFNTIREQYAAAQKIIGQIDLDVARYKATYPDALRKDFALWVADKKNKQFYFKAYDKSSGGKEFFESLPTKKIVQIFKIGEE